VSCWAEENRVLSRKDSARPGPWRSEPHQAAIMDAMTDDDVHTVVLMACSQFTGKSQCMNNVLGRYIDAEPTNIMAIFPTLSDAERWAKGRLDVMIEATPSLREKVPPRKARVGDQTILHRMFPGGQLFIVGSNAPSGLAAQSVRIVMFDEVDRYAPRPATRATRSSWGRSARSSTAPSPGSGCPRRR
jgi:phage terminase large subunit GpA-like protein